MRSQEPKFFLSRRPNNFKCTWNDANKTDWQIIKRFFIAAYANAYAYIYKDSGNDPLELDEQWTTKAQELIDSSLTRVKQIGKQALINEIFSPIKYFYAFDFEQEEKILFSYAQDGSLDAARHTFHYIKHLLALIYYFEESYNGEKAAIEQGGVEGGSPIQYVVARLNDRPIGFISCAQNYKSGQVNLRWVNISPYFQGEGLGRCMLEEVAKRYPHAIGLELYTRKLNKGALHFYPSCGLRPEENIFGSLHELSISKRMGVWLFEKGLFPPDDDLISSHHNTYIGFQGKLTHRELPELENEEPSLAMTL